MSRTKLAMPGGWPHDAPPRSHLFNLAPGGFDGQSREELRSYFRRLCAIHRMRPWTMANRVVVPAALARKAIDVQLRADQCFDVALVSVSSLAAVWADILNALNCRYDLQLLTLLPLKHLLPTNKLVTEALRFCPKCYEADEAMGRDKYDRLLWTIDAVKACPIHEVLLVEASRMGGQPGPLAFYAPGVCRITGASLASSGATSATAIDVDGARRIASLLDEAVFVGEHAPNAAGIQTFLEHAVASLFGGKSAHLAAHLGIGKSQVHGWQYGHAKPSLPRLVQIAQACDCSISDILLGNRCFLRVVPREQIVAPKLAPKRRAGAQLPSDVLFPRLQALAACSWITTVREFATLLDVSEKFVRRVAPEVCEKIVARGIRSRQLALEAKRDAFDQVYREESSVLLGRGIYPSRRKVARAMAARGAGSYRYRDLQRAQQKAMEAVGVLKRRGGRPAART